MDVYCVNNLVGWNQIFTFFVHECADGKKTQTWIRRYTSEDLTSSTTCWGVCYFGFHGLQQTKAWWLKPLAKSGVKKVIYNIHPVFKCQEKNERKQHVAVAAGRFWKRTCKVGSDYSKIYSLIFSLTLKTRKIHRLYFTFYFHSPVLKPAAVHMLCRWLVCFLHWGRDKEAWRVFHPSSKHKLLTTESEKKKVQWKSTFTNPSCSIWRKHPGIALMRRVFPD